MYILFYIHTKAQKCTLAFNNVKYKNHTRLLFDCFTISILLLLPIRLAPADRSSRANAKLRIPPEAFIRMFDGRYSLMS